MKLDLSALALGAGVIVAALVGLPGALIAAAGLALAAVSVWTEARSIQPYRTELEELVQVQGRQVQVLTQLTDRVAELENKDFKRG